MIAAIAMMSAVWAGCTTAQLETAGIVGRAVSLHRDDRAKAVLVDWQVHRRPRPTPKTTPLPKTTTTTTPKTTAPPVTTAPPTTVPPTTVPPVTTAPPTTTPSVTTAPPTTTPATTTPPVATAPATTAPPTTAPPTTAPPATQPAPPPSSTFPTAATAGVPTGVTLVPWTGAWRSSQATGLPTRLIDGQSYKVFSGYVFDSGTTGNYFYVDDPYVLFENVRFLTSGQVSNTSAMLQQASSSRGLIVQTSDFDGGPYHQRGVQADYGVTVLASDFTRFGNAAIEMNNRNGTGSLDAENNYLYEPKGWTRADHTDGIQVGGGKSVIIRNNTVLIQPYGATEGDTSYVSNSALGLWAELGNVTGSVLVDHNRLAGGGRVIYLEQKSPYAWQGMVTVTNNVFDLCFTPLGGVWGPLAPIGLPGQLTWTNNAWSTGTGLTLNDAITRYP